VCAPLQDHLQFLLAHACSKFLTKFAQLLPIFYAMNESYQNSANIRQFFQVILIIFTLNLMGFYIIY
jgi:hypothetical protein